jgi:ubiquinone biosynthesis protein COQ4
LGVRVRRAVGALRVLARDHGRLDQVLVLTQAVNARKISEAVVRLEGTAEGRRLLSDRDLARIDRAHVDFDALRCMPDGTLGREYTRFLDDNGITPDAFEALPDVGDIRSARLMLRLRQTHDLWHVLTGYTPNVEGELLLQSFMYAQTGAPGSLVLVVFGTLRWMRFKRGFVRALRHAFARGKATDFLATVRWEELWSTPVSDLRRTLHCPT